MNEFFGKLRKSVSNIDILSQFNSEEVEADMDELYTYLNTNLEVLNGFLDTESCTNIVSRIWSTICKDIEILLLGEWEEEFFSSEAKSRVLWEEKRIAFTRHVLEVYLL
jgi:hypothetical protein